MSKFVDELTEEVDSLEK